MYGRANAMPAMRSIAASSNKRNARDSRAVGRALPRHYAVSQEVWRPLTRRFPEKVKYQGFLVGEVPVFYDEYRGGPRVTDTGTSDDSTGTKPGSKLCSAHTSCAGNTLPLQSRARPPVASHAR